MLVKRPLASMVPIAALLCVAHAHAADGLSGQRVVAPIVIDTEALVAQAREAAREATRTADEHVREAQRHVLEIEKQLKDMEIDLGTMAFVQSELGGRTEIVKNAPYSAEAVSESVQTLGDGNRIVKQTRTAIARDSYGRTRQERKSASGKSTVYVFDPIEGKSFAMDAQRQTAVRIPRVPTFQPLAPGAPMPPVPPAPSVPPAPPVPPVAPLPGVPVPPTPRAGDPAVQDIVTNRTIGRRNVDGHVDVRVEVLRLPRGEGWPARTPTAFTLPLMPRGKGETTPLGTRDFGGVKADGTQTTHTIPAGEIGNEKPIVISSERWFSPELHVVVFARTVDPRVGETSYRLVNLKREEPPADLFRIPSETRSKR